MYFHKCSKYKPSSISENYIKPVGILETIHQNVRISGEKGDLYQFIGCFLAGVIRSNLIAVQLDHPVLFQKDRGFIVVVQGAGGILE